VVAEGIETASELSTLEALGTDRGQGYLLGKPGSLIELQTAYHRLLPEGHAHVTVYPDPMPA